MAPSGRDGCWDGAEVGISRGVDMKVVPGRGGRRIAGGITAEVLIVTVS